MAGFGLRTGGVVAGRLGAAEGERDPAARLAILARAERRIAGETVPGLTLFHPSKASLFDPERVIGVSRHPRMLQHYWEVEVRSTGARPGSEAAR